MITSTDSKLLASIRLAVRTREDTEEGMKPVDPRIYYDDAYVLDVANAIRDYCPMFCRDSADDPVVPTDDDIARMFGQYAHKLYWDPATKDAETIETNLKHPDDEASRIARYYVNGRDNPDSLKGSFTMKDLMGHTWRKIWLAADPSRTKPAQISVGRAPIREPVRARTVIDPDQPTPSEGVPFPKVNSIVDALNVLFEMTGNTASQPIGGLVVTVNANGAFIAPQNH